MSRQGEGQANNSFTEWVEWIGIPRPLFWGFVAVFVFMVGDGVEANYLAPYIAEHGFTRQLAGTLITIYGAFVAIGSWFAGTLSTIWGPRRVMWLGAAVWVVFDVLFLAVAVPSNSFFLVALFYGLRGFGYPLFVYAFLTWILSVTETRLQSRAVGWFWFAFTAGLPTVGALVAALFIGPLGEYATFWVGLAIVTIGALIGSFAVREAQGMRPIVDESNPEAVENPTSPRRLFGGIDILWRDYRIAINGLVIRTINTASEFGFFVFFPFVFTQQVGLSQGQYLALISIVFATNIFGNLFFGYFGDWFGWRRTCALFGGLGLAIATLLFYFVPVAVGPIYWVSIAVGMLYGFMLAGYIPLPAAMTSQVDPKDTGNAMAIYGLGAGLAVFVGPAIYSVLNPFIGDAGVVIVYAVLYVINAFLAWRFIRTEDDPAEQRKKAKEEARANSA